MRHIQLTVPADTALAIESTLDDADISYYGTTETSNENYETIINFSVEAEEVEPILDRLYEAGLSSDDHGIILDAETDLFEEIQRDRESASEVGRHARISDAELRTEADNQILDPYSFVQMTALSALVATVGLILDSAAAIIGAMVIAPLLGPALSSTVGTVVDDQSLFRRGIAYQLGGVVVAVGSAAVFAWTLRATGVAPPGRSIADTAQIAERLSPDILSLVLALASGAAGVLSLATRTKSAIVGVMIAAALVPPAATAGIGIAWGLPVVAFDSGMLVLVNLLAINLAGLSVFWYLGYRPPTWLGVDDTRRTLLLRTSALVLAILLVSVPLAVTTHTKIQGTQLEDDIENDVVAAIDRPSYADVGVRNVRVVRDSSDVTHPPERVVVTLVVPPGSDYPELSEVVGEAITEETERDIGVRVEYTYASDPVEG